VLKLMEFYNGRTQHLGRVRDAIAAPQESHHGVARRNQRVWLRHVRDSLKM
jgi:hypothetical protein